jgi:hypothetical protein
MFVATEEGLRDRVRDCGSDTACISSRLRTFNARLGLVVVLDFASNPPLISLQLLDTDDGRMLASSVGEVQTGAGGESASIRKGANELLEKAGYHRAGRVLVEVEPPNAHITLGEGVDPDPGTPNRFTLAPGRYPVNAKLEGWLPAKTEVAVATGAEAKVKLALTKEQTIFDSPWFWIGAAIGVVGGAAAVFAVTRHPSRCLCFTAPGVPCGCDR